MQATGTFPGAKQRATITHKIQLSQITKPAEQPNNTGWAVGCPLKSVWKYWLQCNAIVWKKLSYIWKRTMDIYSVSCFSKHFSLEMKKKVEVSQFCKIISAEHYHLFSFSEAACTVTWIFWNWHSLLLSISICAHWVPEITKFKVP